MAKANWKSFWKSYRKRETGSDEDLFFEVGKTVNRQPISEAAFQLSVDLIVRGLELSGGDKLLELCCGNGLVTRKLAPLVGEVQAVDFTEHLIANARKFAPAKNVTFICADALAYLNDLVHSQAYIPSKVLLGDALCYFEPAELTALLQATIKLTHNHLIFMATGIPCEALKWNFYNTPERMKRYQENQLRAESTNEGIGRWWRKEELERITRELQLSLVITEQPHALSNFRMDAIFRSKH
jgi:SAM-dependent methyltransferase